MVSKTKTVKLLYDDEIRMNNNSDIAILFSLDEILNMDDVRSEEKESCRNCYNTRDLIGFIEIKRVPYKLFLDISDRDVKEV